MNMGLIVACLPSLRPYLRRNLRSSNTYSLDYVRSANKKSTTTSDWREQGVFEELGEGSVGVKVHPDTRVKLPDVEETELSLDIPRMEPFNDDKRSETGLIEPLEQKR
jgi:hypothetical protein